MVGILERSLANEQQAPRPRPERDATASDDDAESLRRILQKTEKACSAEPIHSPGAIQPHGLLAVLDLTADRVDGFSRNLAEVAPHLLSEPPSQWLPPVIRAALVEPQADGAPGVFTLDNIPQIGLTEVRGFWAAGRPVVEFEHHPPCQASLCPASLATEARDFLRSLQAAPDLTAAASSLADEIRRITGYERVIVYRFDAEQDGDVVAESLSSDWGKSLFGLHFPAADIPAQARALYRVSRERWVPTSHYDPVPIVNRDGMFLDLDLTFSSYRSLSPVHRKYQENLGVDASLSISILDGDTLWGLLVAHHRKPHVVPCHRRAQASSYVDAFALCQTGFRRREQRDGQKILARKHADLLRQLAQADDLVSALTSGPMDMVQLFKGCGGAAVVMLDAQDRPSALPLGQTPPAEAIIHLAAWVRGTTREQVFASHAIAETCPALGPHRTTASGVLVIFLGEERRQAVLWFRGEEIEEIIWGGRPVKDLDASSGTYLPRKSFDRWVQHKHGHAKPWAVWEVEAAQALSSALEEVVLRQNRRLRHLDQEVQRFAWVSSHHLREPLRHIRIYADLLRRQQRHELDADAAGYLDLLTKGAERANALVSGLVAYSEIGRVDSLRWALNLSDAVDAAAVEVGYHEQAPRLKLEPLPTVFAVPRYMNWLFRELLRNALMFRHPEREPEVRIWAERTPAGPLLAVADNGLGFDPAYADRIFQIFEKLESRSPGIGLGLALCRRIVEYHRGAIWIESVPGQGSTVFFTLPEEVPMKRPETRSRRHAVMVLHEATRDLHERVEHLPFMTPLRAGHVTPEQYRKILARLYGFYEPTERNLFGEARVRRFLTDTGARPKTPALEHDLLALGLSAGEIARLPRCSDAPAPTDDAARLGVLYVLEGAGLGGRVILRRIGDSLGPFTTTATAFHGFHANDAATWWRVFQEALGDHLDASPKHLETAVQSAARTFDSLLLWLEAD